MTIVLPVVSQHVEEAAGLRRVRSVQLRSPHVQLHRLARLDERLAAHLDGVLVAGDAGLALLRQQLSEPDAGAVFALSVCGLVRRDATLLSQIVALAQSVPEAERGWLSALGWISAQDLQGTVRALLGSAEGRHRIWGLTACAMHRTDPGPSLAQALSGGDPLLRAGAWRIAGRLGRRDLADGARLTISQQAAGDEPGLPLWAEKQAAAWALTLWGMGNNEPVRQALVMPQPGQTLPCLGAQRLAAMAAPLDWGRAQVRAMAAQAETSAPLKRRMMRMAAWVGDVQVIPWLIHHMADETWARLAGEAFTLVTGADLEQLDLERKPPENLVPGPNDNPEDHDVAMDEDDSLPWPDASKVQAWWQAHGQRFVAGQRYFMGAMPGPVQAAEILKTGGQRQRIMAAEYRCLLHPGSMLFPVAAPAWRQLRWLADDAASAPS